MQDTDRIGCLVMAAGNSTRYQGNKLAALFRGKPIAEYALDSVPADRFAAVTVVTQYPEIEALARQHGFAVIRNEHPDWGISHTIRLGTGAMQASAMATIAEGSALWNFWRQTMQEQVYSSPSFSTLPLS